MASQYVDPKKKNKRRGQKLSARISIAVVDPNFSYAEPLCRRIRLAGHRCHRFRTGRSLILALDNHRFDAFILEWQLPDLGALEVLRRIRAMYQSSAAVLFISARANEDHVVMALRHGADDYMVKPLRFSESIARLERIVVRSRKRSDEQAQLRIGVYEIDFQQRIVFQAGQPVDLTRKEFDLAVLFLSNLGRRFSGPVICEYVWGDGSAVSGRTIQTYISRLRAKLGLRPASGWRFVATYRHGYRLERVEEHC